MEEMFDFRGDLPGRLCDDLIAYLVRIPEFSLRSHRDYWLEASLGNGPFADQIKYSHGRRENPREDLNNIFVNVDGHRTGTSPKEWFLIRLIDQAQLKVWGTDTGSNLGNIKLQILSLLDIWRRRLDERAGYDIELDAIDRLLEDIKSRNCGALFLNFCSPNNFDRAFLLNRIENAYKNRNNVCSLSPLDFSDDSTGNKIKIVSQVIDSISGDPAFRKVTSRETDLLEAVDIQGDVSLICRATEDAHEPSLLLLQDYHRYPEDVKGWFLKEFFPEIRRRGKIGVILTSEFAIPSANVSNSYLPIDVVEILNLNPYRIALFRMELRDVSEMVYELTGGIRHLVAGLAEILCSNQSEPKVVTEIDAETKRYYFNKYVEKEIMPLFDESIHNWIFVMVILRRFKLQTLRAVVDRYYVNNVENQVVLKPSDICLQLGDWLKTVDATDMLELSEALQRVLRHYLRNYRAGFYKEIIERSQDVYQQSLYEKDWKHYITVYLYSIIDYGLLMGDSQTYIQEAVQRELTEWYKNTEKCEFTPDDLVVLFKALHEDKLIGQYLPRKFSAELIKSRQDKASGAIAQEIIC